MERCPLRLTVLAAWLLRHSARLLRPQRHFARHWRPLRIFRLAVGFFLGLLVYNLSLSHAHGQGRPPGGGPGGDPPPNNNWKIEVSYTGQAQSTYMPSSDIVTYNTNVNGINIPANGSLDLSTLSAKHTLTGGISGGLQFVQQIYGNGDFMGTSWGQLSLSNAALTFTLTWQPKNNDPIANPPPSQIVVCYRRQVTAQAYADYVSGLPPGDPDNGDAAAFPSGTFGSQGSAGTGADAPPTTNNQAAWSDSDFHVVTLPISNPTLQIPINLPLLCHLSGDGIIAQATASGQVNFMVDFCVAGYDTSRFGPRLASHSGGHYGGSADPTFTRWRPVSFSPQLSSQPFRTQPGPLPGPWGNINCDYSLALRQEPTTPNYDLDGQALFYLPSAQPGSYDTPGPPYRVLPGAFVPVYALTDANGDRLLFNGSWQPAADVHSVLTQTGNTFQLTNAGPPGALREKGHYTYTFVTVQTTPLYARLTSIADDVGNQQNLVWNASNSLTVVDSSSGRQLLFQPGAGGYFGAVDAPALMGAIPNTHTALTFDGNGHLTDIQIYPGGSNTLLHSDHFDERNR